MGCRRGCGPVVACLVVVGGLYCLTTYRPLKKTWESGFLVGHFSGKPREDATGAGYNLLPVHPGCCQLSCIVGAHVVKARTRTWNGGRPEGKREMETWDTQKHPKDGLILYRSLIGSGTGNGCCRPWPSVPRVGALHFRELAMNKGPMNSEPESRPFCHPHGLAGTREIKKPTGMAPGRMGPDNYRGLGDGKSHVMSFVVERYHGLTRRVAGILRH